MFLTGFAQNTLTTCMGAAIGGIYSMLSNAIAYGAGLEDAHITVFESNGIYFLEGTAPSRSAVEKASEIARSIVGADHFCNRVEAA